MDWDVFRAYNALSEKNFCSANMSRLAPLSSSRGEDKFCDAFIGFNDWYKHPSEKTVAMKYAEEPSENEQVSKGQENPSKGTAPMKDTEDPPEKGEASEETQRPSTKIAASEEPLGLSIKEQVQEEPEEPPENQQVKYAKHPLERREAINQHIHFKPAGFPLIQRA